MSATNKTTNYELPIFIATDVPSWLTDFNEAMNKIDDSVKSASETGGVPTSTFNALVARVTTLETKVPALETKVSALETNLANLKTTLKGVVKVSASTAGITADEYNKLTKITP